MLERAKEYQELRSEVRKPWESDGSESREPENKAKRGHARSQSAQIEVIDCPGLFPNFATHCKKRCDRKPMGKHEQSSAVQADYVKACNAQEDVAHMHHARITEGQIELLLRDRGQAPVEDVSSQQD